MYKEKTIELIKKRLPEARIIFKKEYFRALSNPHRSMLEIGYRFNNDDKIIMKLQEKFTESTFLASINNCFDEVLKDLAGADYYYNYEKQWD